MTISKEVGLKQIDDTKWSKGEHGELNLIIQDEQGRTVHAWLTLRPEYCDRGHIQLNIDGPLNLDGADSFPRFFFSFEEADKHTRWFLKWRLWKERSFRHELNIPEKEFDWVFEENGQWYFWDYAGDKFGPYETESVARAKILHYGIFLDTGFA